MANPIAAFTYSGPIPPGRAAPFLSIARTADGHVQVIARDSTVRQTHLILSANDWAQVVLDAVKELSEHHG